MKIKLISTLCLSWLVGGLVQAQGSWHNMQLSPVQVSFPEKPRMKFSSESTPVGPVLSENYVFQGKDYNFVLSTTRLPSMALSFRGPEALYEEASEALLKEHEGAQKTSFAPASVAGQSGAELNFRAGDEQGRARFVLVGEKLIVAQAMWKDEASGKVAQRFFDSMRVVQ